MEPCVVIPNGLPILLEKASQSDFNATYLFNSGDLAFSLEMEDADIAFAAAQSKSIDIVPEVWPEDWTQFKSCIQDPDKIYLDIVQSLKRTEEYQSVLSRTNSLTDLGNIGKKTAGLLKGIESVTAFKFYCVRCLLVNEALDAIQGFESRRGRRS